MGWPNGWVEWATAIQTVLTILAFPIGALGLRYARNQLRDTKEAAEAARDAASETTQRLVKARLMMHLTLVRQVESDLAECRQDRDRKGVGRALRRWRILSATTAAIFSDLGSDLGTEIAASIELARIAEHRVEADATGDLPAITKEASIEIASLSDRLTLEAEDMAVQVTTEARPVKQPSQAGPAKTVPSSQ